MYGKLFVSMYEGSLYGNWEAIVTFQQLICLANRDGVVDMTPAAIAGKTSIPVEIIDKGLAHLIQPDPESRSPECDGRRIETLDLRRSWGWRIVNYEKYRRIGSMEDKLVADRERIHQKRMAEKVNRNPDVAQCRTVSRGVADVAHAEVEVEVEAEKKRTPPTPQRGKPLCLPDWIPEKAWSSFLEMRTKIKKPMTERAKEMAIAKLDALRQQGENVAAVLDQSTYHNWQGLFVVKHDTPASTPPPGEFDHLPRIDFACFLCGCKADGSETCKLPWHGKTKEEVDAEEVRPT